MTESKTATYSFHKLLKMHTALCYAARAEDVSPGFRRITLGIDGLDDFAASCTTADALKLYLPRNGAVATEPRAMGLTPWNRDVDVRAYTVRHLRREVSELDLDIYLHGNSPGSNWARSIKSGDAIGFIGPRHDYKPGPEADWQILVGDESSLPAIAAILESLPAGTRAAAFVELADPTDAPNIAMQADASITWLDRGSASAASSTRLEEAVASFATPAGRGFGWVAGHSAAVKRIRAILGSVHGLERDQIFAMGYWR